MNCEDAQNLIGAWIDCEIDDDERVVLESHLSACPDCQSVSDGMRVMDADLTRTFQPRRDAAGRIAEDVIAVLDSKRLAQPTAYAEPRRTNWMTPLLTLVLGFMLALVIFPLGRGRPIHDSRIAMPVTPQPELQGRTADLPHYHENIQVATLVTSIGNVEFKNGNGDWEAATLPAFQCPSNSKVRTSDNGVCELLTSDGAVIRMNRDTEVTLRSPREVEILQGQVWCKSPKGVPVEVCSVDAPAPNRPKAQKTSWSAKADSGSRFLTVVGSQGEGQIVTSQGSVAIETESGLHNVKPGDTVSIVNGQVDRRSGSLDALLAASWIHPLLKAKGQNDPELNDRVNELLAQLGRSKMTLLYERELRSLGEYCVLPLIRYVQSPISGKDPARRSRAISIAADLIVPADTAELIALLSDDSPEVRYHAARGLLRLTGESFGRSPDHWRYPLADCLPTIEKWQRWLKSR